MEYYPGPLGSNAGSEHQQHTHTHTHTQQSGSNSSAACQLNPISQSAQLATLPFKAFCTCAELHLQPEIRSSAFITIATNWSHQEQRTSENRGLLSTVGGPELPVLLERQSQTSDSKREGKQPQTEQSPEQPSAP